MIFLLIIGCVAIVSVTVVAVSYTHLVYELIIREGLSCKEMAVRLGIATNTLNIYVKRILSKRKAESRLRLVVKHYMEAKAA